VQSGRGRPAGAWQRHVLGGHRREVGSVLRTAKEPTRDVGPATVPAAVVRAATAPAAGVPARPAADPAAVLPTAAARYDDVGPDAQESSVRQTAVLVRRPQNNARRHLKRNIGRSACGRGSTGSSTGSRGVRFYRCQETVAVAEGEGPDHCQPHGSETG